MGRNEGTRRQHDIAAVGGQHKGQAIFIELDRLDPRPIGQDVDIRLARDGETEFADAFDEQSFGAGDLRSRMDQRHARVRPMLRRKVGVGLDESTAIDESCPVAGVEIGFGLQPLGQDDIVLVELDVPVLDIRSLLLHDALSVDEQDRGHEDAFDENIVTRAQPETS